MGSAGSLDIANVDFYGVTFPKLENITFTNCFMQEVKCYNPLVNCTFTACNFYTVYLSTNSDFTGSIFDDNTVISRLNCDNTLLVAKTDIEKKVKTLGGKIGNSNQRPEMTEKQIKILKLLEKLLSKVVGRFQFDINDPDREPTLRDILHDPMWSELQELIIKSKILFPKKVDRKGGNGYLYSFSDAPDSILSAINGNTADSNDRLDNFAQKFWAL